MIAARVVHATPRRVRLRVPSQKGDAPWFAGVKRALEACSGVTAVAVNPATASVLVSHEGSFAEVERHARAAGLFETHAEPPHPRTLNALHDRLTALDESLRRRSEGQIDLRTLGFVALLGGSAYQLARGDFLPAGGALLMQALSVLSGARRRTP